MCLVAAMYVPGPCLACPAEHRYSCQFINDFTWWRHQMEAFSALLALCEGNSPVTGGFPSQRPVTRSFDVFFDLRLNKWLRKQSSDLRLHRSHYDVTVMNIPPCYMITVANTCGADFTLFYLRKHKHIFAFSFITQHWDGTGSQNFSSCKTKKTGLSCVVNVRADDVLVTAENQNISSHDIRLIIREYSNVPMVSVA